MAGKPIETPPLDRALANAASPTRHLRIVAGDIRVSDDPNVVLTTILGSCVAACVRDPVAGVGGMNHFMLPTSDDGYWGAYQASLRFGNFAMERLIGDILARGGRRDRLEIKLFGGANVLRNGSQVGWNNAAFVESFVAAQGLAIEARHLYGELPRSVRYHPITGRAAMLELRDPFALTVVETEQAHLRLP